MEPSAKEAIRVISKLTSIDDIRQYVASLENVNPRIWETAHTALDNPANTNLAALQAALKENLSVSTQEFDHNFLKKHTQAELDSYKKLEAAVGIMLPSPPPRTRDQKEQIKGHETNTDEDKALVDELAKLLETIPKNWKGSTSASELEMESLRFVVKEYKKGEDLNEWAGGIEVALDMLTTKNSGIYRTPEDEVPFTPLEIKLNEIKQKMAIVNERQGEEADYKAGKPDRRGQSWER